MRPSTIVATIYLLVVFSAPFAYAQQPKTLQPEFAKFASTLVKAEQALRNDSPKDAISLLEPVVQEAPGYYLAQYNLGIAYVAAGMTDSGIEALTHAKAIVESKNLPDKQVYNALGYALTRAARYEEAESAFKNAEEHFNALDVETKQKLLNNTGSLYMVIGQYPDAIKYFTRASNDFGSEFARTNLLAIKQSVGSPVETGIKVEPGYCKALQSEFQGMVLVYASPVCGKPCKPQLLIFETDPKIANYYSQFTMMDMIRPFLRKDGKLLFDDPVGPKAVTARFNFKGGNYRLMGRIDGDPRVIEVDVYKN